MKTMRGRARDFAFRHVGGTAAVLIYHRVNELERDPQLLAVSPRNFDAQMKVLARDYRVMSVRDLAEACSRHSVPDHAVAVTFDDGYADNLLVAAPILEKHGVPATVFISSGFTDRQQEFWWDQIGRLVLGPGVIAREIHLRTGDASFDAVLGAQVERSPDDADADRIWNVLEDDKDARHILYRDLCDLVRPLSIGDRRVALAQLEGAVSGAQSPSGADRPLSESEIADLDGLGLVDVGSHSVNHTVLSARTADEQLEEIERDKTSLEVLCGRAIETFSYPYGGVTDYTSVTVEIVKNAGFTGACSNHPGVIKPWTDAYRLPRNLVRDWDAESFSAMLGGLLDDPR